MQTFLPFPDFYESARVLDNKRLGTQRSECLNALRCLMKPEGNRWREHPAVMMWEGHIPALVAYGLIVCNEWKKRGFKDTVGDKILEECKDYIQNDPPMPKWFGREDFHASHRSKLLSKMPEHYEKFGWKDPDNLDWVWPVPSVNKRGKIKR